MLVILAFSSLPNSRSSALSSFFFPTLNKLPCLLHDHPGGTELAELYYQYGYLTSGMTETVANGANCKEFQGILKFS